ncbi:hypothetical protein O181_056553 [Austropuccinia psidii MF-1]|uniref:Uncharacterized protein n=1 Tax=Austropuccinia psidii MF-1 TaxID=1389203 RepID=A0A9Q3EDB0_9BASI|nr:hypothetical protein [Austropuccinia psidii MF-1]
MPVQHSPPARQTRSQARAQAVLTPTPRAPLDGTPSVPQLRAKLDKGPILEGALIHCLTIFSVLFSYHILSPPEVAPSLLSARPSSLRRAPVIEQRHPGRKEEGQEYQVHFQE